MTIIEVSKKNIYVHGHSGYATAGKDIICAAISTLVESTCNYLECTSNNIRYLAGEGVFTIYLDEINSVGEKIIKTFCDMVEDLVTQYPKYIEKRFI